MVGPRSVAAGIAFLSLLFPASCAQAHEVFGLTGLPALLLHPLVVPEHAFVLVAVVLVASRMARDGFLSTALSLVAGMLGGKAAHLAMPWLSVFWYAPLVAALAGGLAVTAFGRIGARAGAVLVFTLGFVLSVGLLPEEPTQKALAMTVLAAILTALSCLFALGLPLSRVKGPVGGVLVRVAGAWLAAIAMLNLALALDYAVFRG
ncbi:MAG: hypothetical protein VYD64_06300 [Pseudomonadota bacterium]|nr:hypothetical protein [Pseudomonadota bacterium]